MKVIFLGIGAATSLAAFCLIVTTPVSFAARQYPVDAVAFLNQRAAQRDNIVILNEYSWGGYLIWNAPEIKVFIDGRMPHWIAPDGTSAMKDYISIFLTKPDPVSQQGLLKKWGVNTVLIQNPGTDQKSDSAILIKTLQTAGWSITYKDTIAIVLQYGPNPDKEH